MPQNKNIYYAKTVSDVLYHLKNVSGIRVLAGCTGIVFGQNSPVISMGKSAVTISNIAELKKITKTERYIEFGSATTLSQILAIEQKKIPTVLHDAILSIGNPYTANIATIGGNICAQKQKMTCFAPLLALDAKLEIRNENDIELIPLSKFTGVPDGTFVSKVRVPIEDWDISIFKRTGTKVWHNDSNSFTFLANTQKNILSDVRISFCGHFVFRNKELENILIGNKLPLSEKNIAFFLDSARKYFGESVEKNKNCTPLVKAQFINLLALSLENFT